jgi:hypothetical protein
VTAGSTAPLKPFVMPAWVFPQIMASAIVKMFFVCRLGRLNCPSGIYEDFPFSMAPYLPDEPNPQIKNCFNTQSGVQTPYFTASSATTATEVPDPGGPMRAIIPTSKKMKSFFRKVI